MARNGVKSGGRDIKKGECLNPGGLRNNMRKEANDFRDWAFKLFKDNQKRITFLILSSDVNLMLFLRMLALFVPKEIDLGGQEGKPLTVKVVKE